MRRLGSQLSRIAATPTTLYALEKADFLEALTGHPAAHREAHRIADRLVPVR